MIINQPSFFLNEMGAFQTCMHNSGTLTAGFVDVPDVHDLEVKLLSANDNSLSLEVEDNETSALWCPKGWDFGFWERADFRR